MRRLVTIMALLAVCLTGAAQQTSQSDSLVRLMSATSAQLINKDGQNYRQVIGPARFLHNDTYLICDTALWYVDKELIKAVGNVQIIQDQTVLTSDNLDYVIPENTAQFRGGVVQLQDKDNNVLRTRWLDYNTKDSVAVFRGGAAMRDKDGQIIESLKGTYDSKIKTFFFNEDVNMFTDSIFVKTESLKYETEKELATFGRETDVWREDDMLSSNSGWYDRGREVFFFTKEVHGMSEEQEVWSDSLFFYRNTTDVELLGSVQIIDTTREVAALAGYVQYIDSLSQVKMLREPAVMMTTKNSEDLVDTVYVGADTLIYRSIPRCEIPEALVADSEQRLSDLNIDPVLEYRRKARESAEEEARRTLEDNPGLAANRAPKKQDTKTEVKDTLSASIPQADTLSVPSLPDSTEIGFVTALGNVKVFRSDMQVSCDSLLFCDLDSLARLYKNPIVWNEGNRQYSADSIVVLIQGRSMRQASLMSNAFIIVQEDSLCFDQIKATEMMAYFDSSSTSLSRFDALGGAASLFYLKENDVYATVNKTESKMLSAWFKDGEIEKVYYFESPKNDAAPIAQMTEMDREIKGFNWSPQLRPEGPEDITSLQLRPLQRNIYKARPKATFVETEHYFPGYMQAIYDGITEAQKAKALRNSQKNSNVADANNVVLPAKDTVAESNSPFEADTAAILDNKAKLDSLSKGADSLATASDSVVIKESRAAAARRARWERLDARDSAREKAKMEKALERKRRKTRKILEANAREEKRDLERLEKFRKRYEKKKSARKENL